jgi:hypothetical protein
VKDDYQGFMKYISNSWQKENFVNLKKFGKKRKLQFAND